MEQLKADENGNNSDGWRWADDPDVDTEGAIRNDNARLIHKLTELRDHLNSDFEVSIIFLINLKIDVLFEFLLLDRGFGTDTYFRQVEGTPHRA